MTPELQKQLADLAARLGTTVEHLWGVLVRQAYVDGVSSFLAAGTRGLFIIALVWAWFHLWPKAKTQLVASLDDAIRPPGWFVALFDVLCFFVLALIIWPQVEAIADNIYWVLSDFANPEFYALHQLPGWPR
jgi:hypothetical protein